MAAMPAAAAAEESDGDPPGEGDQGGVDQNDVPAPLPESTIVLLRYMQGMHDEDSTSSSDESDQDEDEVAFGRNGRGGLWSESRISPPTLVGFSAPPPHP